MNNDEQAKALKNELQRTTVALVDCINELSCNNEMAMMALCETLAHVNIAVSAPGAVHKNACVTIDTFIKAVEGRLQQGEFSGKGD